ncbi:MAG: sugar transferase, partial [Salibacteraceae bacterium]
MYSKYIKRIFDVVLALLLVFITFPISFITYFLLFFQNKRKVFFYQERPGLLHKPFFIIKFKSMTDKKGSNGELLPDVNRITKFGAFIRKYSIDELPQLINVLKGEMSLIGPRPLLFKYIPLYSEVQDRRHEVRPGITGWAQVNGRNSIDWKSKFSFDVYYVDNVSLSLDCRILWLTFLKVLKSEGVNQ